jgi:leucyl aminopeptidase (aminopeptidase T)
MSSVFKVDKELVKVSETVMKEVLGAKPGESMLIVTNPEEDALSISKSLFNAAITYEVEPVIVVQKKRSTAEKSDKRALAALSTIPDIYASVSTLSFGQDFGFNILGQRFEKPYKFEGEKRDMIFDLNRVVGRGFWSPDITTDMWKRVVPVNYEEMKKLGEKIAAKLTNAKEVHVTTEKGTDVTFSCEGMICDPSTGPYTKKGDGGNLPTGESFITPKPGTTNGKIVFDGGFGGFSIGDIIIEEPVEAYVENGKVEKIKGGKEAQLLRRELDLFTEKCYKMAGEGKFNPDVYASNVTNIGEAGFGVNEKAELRKDSSLLEWEKVLRTVHFAIGRDYGVNPKRDPPLNMTLNHFDGLVKYPSVTVDGKVLMENGWYVL